MTLSDRLDEFEKSIERLVEVTYTPISDVERERDQCQESRFKVTQSMIPIAREIIAESFRNEGLLITYIANISMRIKDNHPDIWTNTLEMNQVAVNILNLIFDCNLKVPDVML